LLRHMGILEGGAPEPRPTRLMRTPTQDHFVHAPCAGLFEQTVDLGDTVRAGDLCGRVHFVDDPAREPVPCHFAADGVVVCQRHPARVERGDCVAHTAVDVA
jgi:uncharacterized protein